MEWSGRVRRWQPLWPAWAAAIALGCIGYAAAGTSKIDCDFQTRGSCGYKPTNDYQYLYWQRVMASKWSQIWPTGTLPAPGQYIMWIKFDGPWIFSPDNFGKKAELTSPVQPSSDPICELSFRHILTADHGKLVVMVRSAANDSADDLVLWTHSDDDHTGRWMTRTLIIPNLGKDIKIVFAYESTRKGTSRNVNVIADVKGTTCDDVGITTLPAYTGTYPPRPTRPTGPPAVQEPVDCDFSQDLCGYTPFPSQTMDLRKVVGAGNGEVHWPQGQAPQQGEGWVYARVSEGSLGQGAFIKSRPQPAARGICQVKFWHLVDTSVGRLTLKVTPAEVTSASQEVDVWTSPVAAAAYWREETVRLPFPRRDFSLIFEVQSVVNSTHKKPIVFSNIRGVRCLSAYENTLNRYVQ